MGIRNLKQVGSRMGVLAGAGLLVPFVMFTATASAGGWDSCQSQQFCAWVDINGGGTEYVWAGTWATGTCVNVPPSFNDQMSSALNKYSNHRIGIYKDANCGTPAVALQPGEGFLNMANWDVGFNDVASSIKFE